ncbi:uncharacterized protein LOC131947771 [Physella acuta]|uniref:uncharacterized protein LOC131947771 n=1 Tax=Physella acuta TaxID=109671 RepID=UPI0027DD1D8B|nr:uncharacterized protein LOC131947771 [Physella acuta]XP_059165053.1 uncharacterized protein LOC131947771 [Physella acuta]XP_059165054.1 uncharacterized protein LOC131947771 [Physella acuta]
MKTHAVLFVIVTLCYIQWRVEGCEDAKMDMIFVIDSSGSVAVSDYELGKEFMKDLLVEADIDNGNVRVGAVVFSDADYIQFHLDKHKTKAELFQAISAIPYISGWTNTADGLRTMRTTMFSLEHGDRPNITNIAVVITDGQSNRNSERTIPEADAAKAQGIPIYAIGVGGGVTDELDNMASKPLEDYRFGVTDYKQLKNLRHKLFSVICSSLAAFTDPPTTPTTPKPVVIRRVNTRFDLVFVLDATSSVSKSNFDLMIKFIKDFIYEDDIYNENVRIGVVTSSNSHIQFHLDKHSTKDDIINDTDAIAYPPNDNSNTADAIRTMRTAMFNESNGDRLDVDNIAIVLTTGVSNSQNIQSESDAARTQGIHIFVVGIGLRDTTQLDVIANKPVDQNRFTVNDFIQLEDLKENVFPAVLTAISKKRSEKSDCPTEPAAVELQVFADPRSGGFFVCSLSDYMPDGVNALITLHVDGEEFNKQINSSTKEGEIYFSDINKPLFNEKVYCSVFVKYLVPGSKECHEESSNVITPTAICPHQTTLRLVEGQGPVNLVVKLTAPPELYCTGRPGSPCDVEVVTEILPGSDELNCSNTEIIPQVVFETKSCGLKFSYDNWKDGIIIPVKATIDRIIDGDRFLTIQTYFTFNGQQSTQEKCDDIQVTVVDKDKTTICHSVNDPHIATFDKYYYDNHILGDFILYKHKTLPYQVQVNYRSCSSSRMTATCNCITAVQSGDDVVVFNSCDARQNKQRPDAAAIDVQIFINGELTPGTKIKQLAGGQQYEVLLPTGTVVAVMPSQFTFMNIFITASPSDFKETEGLCGNFNGKKDDDLDNIDVDIFNSKWRANDTIYCGVPPQPARKPSTYSSCTQGLSPVCKPGMDVSRCPSDANDITAALVLQSKKSQTSCSTESVSRKKRQANLFDVLNTRITSYTLDEAKRNCSDYLKNSRTVKACTNQLSDDRVKESITNCAYDLVSTGLFDWAVSHVSNLAEECITRAEQNQSSWTGEGDTPGEPVLPQAIVTQLCVRDCGDNGQCLNSFCKCSNGYFGESCQFGPSTVPHVFGVDEACDIQESFCETVKIDGDFFTSSDNLSCHINYASVDTRARKTESSAVVRAEYISMYQVGCTLPTRRSAYITVTNDGVHQSENVYLHVVHNSSCQTCVINDNKTDVDCHMITNACVIEGQCYLDYQEDSVDSCNICHLDSSNTTWTRRTDSECVDGLSEGTIIAISFVCVLLIVALVLVLIIYRKMRRAEIYPEAKLLNN